MNNPNRRRNWNKIQPTSLRQALELCKDHARETRNLSVERLAERIGLTDHWTLYKWIQTGRIPTNMIGPFEDACGIDFVTRWLAGSKGKLLISIPTGRRVKALDIQALQEQLTSAVGQLLAFYDGRIPVEDALAAIHSGMCGLAWHHVNVSKHLQPELNLEDA